MTDEKRTELNNKAFELFESWLTEEPDIKTSLEEIVETAYADGFVAGYEEATK